MNSLQGRITGIIAALAIVTGSVALALLLISLAPEPESRELPPQIPFVQTETATAATGPVPVLGAGIVRPAREVEIAAQVGGRISQVAPTFQSGGQVSAGQELFRIDDEDYRLQVESALADVAARQVALLEAEQQAGIAAQEYQRFRSRQDGAPDPSPLTLREPQLQAARAALDRDEARLAEARLALSRTVVTAPFAGFIRRESIDEGQIIAAGMPVGTLIAADAAETEVSLPDSDAALIPGLWELRPGDDSRQVPARVSASRGDQEYAWSAYVDRAEVAVDPQTRTVGVVIRVPAPFAVPGNPPLLVGEFVDVEIEGVALPDVWRIPRAALQADNEVWAVAGGNVRIVPVRVLQRADGAAWVSGPLRGGEPLITGGLQFAVEGMAVLTGSDSPP